jgi:hypothetical protein
MLENQRTYWVLLTINRLQKSARRAFLKLQVASAAGSGMIAGGGDQTVTGGVADGRELV